MLRPREEEMLLPTVRAFMNTDGFRDNILDGEVSKLDSAAISVTVCVSVAACLCLDGVFNTLGE